MEGTQYGESAVYGHAPPLDARSRKQRQKGEPPKVGESVALAARSTPDAHTHAVDLAARAARERERSLSAQQHPETGCAVRGDFDYTFCCQARIGWNPSTGDEPLEPSNEVGGPTAGKVGIYFSDFFDVDRVVLEAYGAFNISLVTTICSGVVSDFRLAFPQIQCTHMAVYQSKAFENACLHYADEYSLEPHDEHLGLRNASVMGRVTDDSTPAT